MLTFKHLSLAFFASSLLVGCMHNDSVNQNTSERFQLLTNTTGNTIHDTTTKLEWVNGIDTKADDGCKGFPKNAKNTEAYIKKEAMGHCESLHFAGHNDWRIATAVENQQFINAMHEENKTPYYAILACPRVIGSQAGKVVTTNTHNTKPIGKIIPWKDGGNGGVRCVRAFK